MLRRLMVTVVLGMAAFLAGMTTERSRQADICDASGGQWMRAGFCLAENR